MIRTKPSTPEYRDAWDRVFGKKLGEGDRVVWHAPIEQFPSPAWKCKCDHVGTITATSRQSNGYLAIVGVRLDSGGAIDPSIDPDMLRPVGDECPLGGGPIIPVGASVD